MLSTWNDADYVKMEMPPKFNYSMEQFYHDHPELHRMFYEKLGHILVEIFQFSERDMEGYISLLEQIIATGLIIPRVVHASYGDDVGIMIWSFTKQEHVQPNMAESLDLEMIDHIFSTMISVN
jgi:hypothetical protein